MVIGEWAISTKVIIGFVMRRHGQGTWWCLCVSQWRWCLDSDTQLLGSVGITTQLSCPSDGDD